MADCSSLRRPSRPLKSTAKALTRALAATKVVVGEDDLLLVGLPCQEAPRVAREATRQGRPFVSLSVDDAETSLVLPAADWQQLAAGFPGARVAGPYRLLTFDLALPLDLVGYLAAITAALAARGVSLYALSAYTRDHVLVRRPDLPAAREALAELIADARRRSSD